MLVALGMPLGERGRPVNAEMLSMPTAPKYVVMLVHELQLQSVMPDASLLDLQ